MNKEAQEVLNNIVKKEPYELTEADKGFLRARRSYVSAEDMERFSSVFEDIEETPTLSYQDLVKKAKELGIKHQGVKKAELEQLIAEAQN